jgi:hypothetical protein
MLFHNQPGKIMKNNDELKKLIKVNSSFDIDVQMENGVQVAVWCKTFGKNWSICYQNGDMNGNKKGQAIFTNDGANVGLKELRNILKDRPEFQHLIDLDTYWSYEELDELINEFCAEFAEENSIADHFEND